MKEGSINLVSYLIGFIASVLLSLGSYFAVVSHLLGADQLILVILSFALAQLLVQLIFFLHLGQESKPAWNLIAFLSTVSIILIVVIGSLWIMSHLNYNHKTPVQINNTILQEEGIQK